MNTGAHDAGGGFTTSVGANAARGIFVIAAAVIVGLLLMQYGLSSDSTAEAVSSTDSTEASADANADDTDADAAGDDSASTATTATTAAPVPAETTAPPAPATVERDPSEVRVLALNAAVNKRGIAGRATAIVNSNNYITLKAQDAIADQPTEILYMETYEGSAVEIAKLFGLDPALYVKPFNPDASPTNDPDGAHVLIVIGLDEKIDV